MPRYVFLAFALTKALAAQDGPDLATAERLLRDGPAAALEVAAKVEPPGRRARLQAALRPLGERPAALLAVARAFVESGEADRAILAGASATLLALDRAEAVPALAEFDEFGDDRPEPEALAPVVEGLLDVLHERRALGGDRDLLDEAEHLLRIASVTRCAFEVARVEPGIRLAVPIPRAEEMILRAWRAPPRRLTFADLPLDREPERLDLLPAGDTLATVAALPRGSWLVELASVAEPWRAVRAVEVSELDVVALVEREQVALMLARHGTPVSGTVASRVGDLPLEAARKIEDAALLSIPAVAPRSLVARDEHGNPARLDLPVAAPARRGLDRWLAHVMVDRPIHRPGERIEARVVLREATWSGAGLDAQVKVAPAADQELELRAFEGHHAEQRIRATTDARGLASFVVEVPDAAPPHSAGVSVAIVEGERRIEVFDDCVSTITSFARPAIVVEANGPTRANHRSTDLVTVHAHARWPSGGPAANVTVRAEVSVGRWRRTERELRTDREGRAALPIDPSDLDPGPIRVDFTFLSPDGREETATHTIEVEGEKPAQPADARVLELHVAKPIIAGRPCVVRLTGRPDEPVLLAVGRGSGTRLQIVDLDERGEAELRVTPAAREWPLLDLCAATREGEARVRVPFRLRESRTARIDLPSRCAPGETIACRVDVGVPDALVTLAIVDEGLYALARDRTQDPARELRPHVPAPRWCAVRTPRTIDALRVFAPMMAQGRIPPLQHDDAIGRTGAPGTPGPAMAVGAPLRAEFRSTAVFATFVADTDGVAEHRFVMPDDLTTWRATIVVVEPNGAASLARRAIVSRQALAAEPRLPRVLRAGDRIELPIVIDRGAGATNAPERVVLDVSADGLDVGDAHHVTDVPPGMARTVVATLRAPAAAHARLDLHATAGELGDRMRREVDVAPDLVARALTVDGSGDGSLRIAPHPDSSPMRGLTVTVVGSDVAVRRMLQERLEKYPYGCVEQTLSALLPFFAEVRGARAHGLPEPRMTRAFRQRLDAGLHRLRALQTRAGGAFAWWPDGDADLGMTALVVHGLCVMRDGGDMPTASGLRVDVDLAPFAAAIERATRQSPPLDSGEVQYLEIVAACTRWEPTAEAPRAAAAAAIDRGARLPPGLATRLGIALHAAGDLARARRCLTMVARGQPDPRASAFPGEHPLAVEALAAELSFRLGALQEDAVDALLQHTLAESGSTYATATALAALALVRPTRGAVGPVAVEVRAGDAVRTVTLDANRGYVARSELPFADVIEVEADSHTRLHVMVRTERAESASAHPGWASPLRVERALCRRTGDRLVTVGEEAVRVGERLTLRIVVSAPVAARYVVVACALPAGLDLPVEPSWLQRFDDRVAFTAERIAPGVPFERTFDVVATHAGRTVWPPTVASAMYVPDCDGGSRGAWLEIADAEARGNPDDVRPCFAARAQERAQERAAAPSDGDGSASVAEIVAEIEDVWFASFEGGVLGLAPEPDAARVAAVRVRLAALATPDRADFHDLPRITRLRDGLPAEGARSTSRNLGPAWRPWRSELRGAIDGLHRTWTRALLRRLGGGVGDDPLDHVADVLIAAAEHWPDEVEQIQARLLRIALAEDGKAVRDVLRAIESPARSEELRNAVRTAFASRSQVTRDLALWALPPEDLAALPPAVLVELQGGLLEPMTVAALGATPAGRAELRLRCDDPEFIGNNADQLLAGLPAEAWRRLSLDAFVALWEAADDEAAVVHRLVHADVPSAELAARVGTDERAFVRTLCADVLRQRGVRGLGEHAMKGENAAAWDRLLRAIADRDASALERVLDAEYPATQWADTHALRDFAATALAEIADADILARRADDMPVDSWPQAFRRIGAAAQARLLRLVETVLVVLPTTPEPTVHEALWDYGLRRDDLEWTIDSLCETEAGAEFARQRAATLPDPVLRARALDWIESAADDWPRSASGHALWLLRQEGSDRAWSDAERRALEHALLLRGLW